MNTKLCSQCKLELPLADFFKAAREKSGYASECKTCNTKYKRSPTGVIGKIYASEKKSSKDRGYEPPQYSLDELKEWCLSNPKWDVIYQAWVDSGYLKQLVPSVDRLNDYETYSLDNIQLLTWGQNKAKFHSDVLNGVNNKFSREVIQMDLDGNELARYASTKFAARMLGGLANHSGVGAVCRGLPVKKSNRDGTPRWSIPVTYKGFKWKFANTFK